MTIRTATPADLDAVAAIEAACFPPAEAASRASLAGRLAAYPEHFWLLEEDGQVVAFINGLCTDTPDLADEMYADPALHSEAGAWQMIFGLDTLPAYRRRGCAARLLRHLLAEAKRQGRKGAVLTCKARLVPYYASFGFVNEGLSPSTHGDAVWYQMRASLNFPPQSASLTAPPHAWEPIM